MSSPIATPPLTPATPPPQRPAPAVPFKTVAELLHALGDIPPERVWMTPLPATATEDDVLHADDHEDRLCELVDGVLVEKARGMPNPGWRTP